ncbi:MAG: magnesium transporter [Magnetococcus sp. DMHC-6]
MMTSKQGTITSKLLDSTVIPHRILEQSINRLLNMDAHGPLQKLLSKALPADLARILDSFPHDMAQQLFFLIPNPTQAASVLKDLRVPTQMAMLNSVETDKLVPILDRLAPDTRTDLIDRLEPEAAARIMERLNLQSQREVHDLMQYASNTAGGIMTSQFFALSENITVAQAIDTVRELAAFEMVFYLYIVGDTGRLTGVSSLRQLLLSKPEKTLGEIMKRRVVKVHTDTPQDDVAELVSRYRLLAIPVVDEEGVLLGMVTVDDVIQVMEREMTGEMLKVAGTSSLETDSQTPLQTFRIRLPWLMTTFLGGVSASMVIHWFDTSFSHLLFITAFLPLILGMADNFGSVVATVASRNLTSSVANLQRFSQIFLRELQASLLLGLFYGLLSISVAWFLFHNLVLGETVGVAILTNMVMTALVATGLPFLFRRLKADPSLASGVIVTTVVNLLGVANYLLVDHWMQI